MDDFYIRWGRSEYADGDSKTGSKDQTHSHSESTEQARRHNLNSNPTHGHSISTDPAPDNRKRLSGPARSSRTNISEESSRAILAGCCTDLSPEKHARAMSELRGLAEACGLLVVSVLVQNAPQITHATYLGSGKVIELKHEIEAHDADIVLFNEALTPMQMRRSPRPHRADPADLRLTGADTGGKTAGRIRPSPVYAAPADRNARLPLPSGRRQRTSLQ